MNFESRNPATGELLGVHPEHDKAEIEVRLQRALGRLAALVTHPTAGANRLPHSAGQAAGRAGRELWPPNHRPRWASRSRTPFSRSRNPLGPPATSPKQGRLISSQQPIAGIPAEIVYESLGPIFSVQPWNVPFWQVLALLQHPQPWSAIPRSSSTRNRFQGCAEALENLVRDAGGTEGLYVNLAIPVEACAAVIADPRVRAVTVYRPAFAPAALLRRKPPKSERERCWNSAVPIHSSFWRTPTLRKPCSSL